MTISFQEHAENRKWQLKKCFAKMTKQDPSLTVIFGGDLNMRDKELQETGGIPDGAVDLWQHSGSRKECQYTWDMMRNTNVEVGFAIWYKIGQRNTENDFQFPGRFKPRCRFDRLYLRQAAPAQTELQHFGLFGIEKVAHTQSFPSDHWGLLAGFKVDSN